MEMAKMMIKTGLLAAAVTGCAALASGVTFAAVSATSPDLSAKDARITSQVRQQLSKDIPGSQYRMSVSTEGDGVVVLSGQTDNGLSEARALQDARNVRGVTAVENHLQVVA